MMKYESEHYCVSSFNAPAVPPPDCKSEASPLLPWMSILAILRQSQTGIPRTNVPGLYIAIFRIYLLLCSYVLCADIYFSTTSQPAPTEPWQQLESPQMITAPFLQMEKLLTEYFGGYLINICTWSGFTTMSITLISSSIHVFSDNRLSHHRYIPHQHLAPVFWREYHVVRKQRYSMSVMSQFF